MANGDEKQMPTSRSETHASLLLSSVCKIAAAANVTLGKPTMAVYLERLGQLSSVQILRATRRTIEEWTEPSKMPPLSYIIARCYLRNSEVPPNDAEEILKRQITDGASRAKVPHEEVLGWLEEGKIRQQLEYAKLEEDPEWQAQYDAFGKPGLTKRPTTVPTDSDERKTWEADMARKHGWR